MTENTFLAQISARHCKRAFLPQPVSREVLEDVLRAASNAPSSKNTQSWEVAILTGKSRDELSRKLCDAFNTGVSPEPDYLNRPAEPEKHLKDRESTYGAALFAHGNVDRADKAARHAHRLRNFQFFDAPVEMIFHLPHNAVAGNFLDLGLFMQNVMLGLQASGLGSCPQFSVASYSPVVHEHMGWTKKRTIVAGMAVGYFDPDDPANQFIPERIALDDFCQWES